MPRGIDTLPCLLPNSFTKLATNNTQKSNYVDLPLCEVLAFRKQITLSSTDEVPNSFFPTSSSLEGRNWKLA